MMPDDQRDNFNSIFNQPIVGFAQASIEGKFEMVNDRYCQLVGRSREELLKLSLQDVTHAEDLPLNLQLLRRLIDTGEPFTIDKRYVRPDGSSVWIKNYVSLIKDSNNRPLSILGIVLDQTEARKYERQREEEKQRLKFLSDISVLLSSSLDIKTIIKMITDLAVPVFGDWCYIHLKEDENGIVLADCSIKDETMLEKLREFAKLAATPGSQNAVATAMQTEKSVMRNFIDDAYYVRAAANARQLELFRELRARSVIVAPLKSRGHLLGAITIAYQQDISYSESDVYWIEEVARRASLAIDNARLYGESRKAVQSRDEFISLASHELKTPVTSMILLNDYTLHKLKNNKIHLEDSTFWDKLFRDYGIHINRISRLVDNMLDITRLQLGTFKMQLATQDMGQAIRLICDHLAYQIERAGCSLEVKLSGNLQGVFDSYRIEQVLNNLITNAMKYAPNKAIHVLANEEKNEIHISIRDEGHGIAPAELERIFSRFERGIDGGDVSGLGLGLYISRKIIEAHHGRIWAVSEIGKGTTMHIQLPKQPANFST